MVPIQSDIPGTGLVRDERQASPARGSSRSGGSKDPSSLPGRSGEKWGRGRTIIVADDEDIVRHLIQEVLQHDGFKVLPTENEEVTLALCACETLPIHALIADYHLGRHSGLWLARRVLEQLPDLRIVLMSGDLTVRSRVKSADIPAVRSVLIKPFGVRSLRRALREALDDQD